MAISTSNNSITALGNGVQTVFGFNFIAGAATNINVNLINTASGTSTLLSPSAYTVSINAPATGQLWGVGGTITYPISGSPIATGFQLQISRILPLTQVTSLANQGDFLPNVIEQALDTLEMQIQQLSARTTQFRGTWATGLSYSIGDIVQDGAAGLNTLNYYICINANVSGVWATDLANGDWAISALAAVPTANLTLTGAVVGTQVGSVIATTLANNIVGTANIQALAVGTALLANNAVTYAKMQQMSAGNTILGNATASAGPVTEIAIGQNQLFGRGATGNLAPIALGPGLGMTGTTLSATGAANGATTSSNSSTLVLTNASTAYQIVSMTTAGLSVKLPDATTLSSAGANLYLIKNAGSFSFTVIDNAGQPRSILAPGEAAYLSLGSISTASGNWVAMSANPFGSTQPVSASIGLSSAVAASTFINGFAPLTSTSAVCLYYNSAGTSVLAAVMTITGETISYGTPVTVATLGTGISSAYCCALSSTLALFVVGTSTGTASTIAVTLSVSGTTITVNTPVTVAATNMLNGALFQTSATSAQLFFQTTGTAVIRSVAISVSGTVPTINTIVNGATPVGSTYYIQASATSFVAMYIGASSFISAQLWTVSGITTTAQTVVANFSNSIAATGQVTGFFMTANLVVCVYQTASTANNLVTMTISGTTLAKGVIWSNLIADVGVQASIIFGLWIYISQNLIVGASTDSNGCLIFVYLKFDPGSVTFNYAGNNICTPGTFASLTVTPDNFVQVSPGKYLVAGNNFVGSASPAQIINIVN